MRQILRRFDRGGQSPDGAQIIVIQPSFNPLFLNMDYSQRLQHENRVAEPG